MSTTGSTKNQPGTLGYRLIIILVFLALGALAAVIFLRALGAIEPGDVAGGWEFGTQFLQQVADDDLPWRTRALIVGGAALAGLLCFAVVRNQVRPRRAAASSFHMLDADDRGFVVVDSRGIAAVAEQAAMSAHGVIGAEVQVKGSGTSPIRLRVRAEVYPGANLKLAGTAAREAVATAVDEMIGLQIQDITVTTHVVEVDAMTRVLA
ncbi:MAG: hypothetical protein AAGC55_24190 [Myxococcota bacterium]